MSGLGVDPLAIEPAEPTWPDQRFTLFERTEDQTGMTHGLLLTVWQGDENPIERAEADLAAVNRTIERQQPVIEWARNWYAMQERLGVYPGTPLFDLSLLLHALDTEAPHA